MPLGDVTRLGDSQGHTAITARPVAVQNRLGPRKAMTLAAAAFLKGLEFTVYGGESDDRLFSLNTVFEAWPSPDKELPYPCASIVDVTSTDHRAHNLTPTPLEDTWGEFDNFLPCSGLENRSVLWKEAEAYAEFQVDFWTDVEADREAIEAALPAQFSPNDGQYGVFVEGPLLYYSRPVRLTLKTTRFDDSANTAYSSERRLRCLISAECDIVSLRTAEVFRANTGQDVNDPNDPEEG
jgi:hypothetical protein